MKVNQNISGLYGPNVPKNPAARATGKNNPEQLTAMQTAKRDPLKEAEFSLKRVLSGREVNSLQVLFGYEQNLQESLYGVNKVRNVNAGMLLDVRG